MDYILSLPYSLGVGLITKCLEKRRDKEIREMWLAEMSMLPFLDKDTRESFPKTFEEYKSTMINKSRKSTASKEEILNKAMETERKLAELRERGELVVRDI